MENSIKTCALFILMAFSLNATPNLNRFHKITANEGLASSHVFSIVTDSYGFTWIGTSGGLNRFDGSKIITFHEDENNPKSLKGKNILALYVDNQGILWIGNDAGLSRYNYETEDFTFIEDITKSKFETERIETITNDNQGDLWFGGIYLYKLDKSENRLTKFSNRNFTEQNVDFSQIKSLVCDKYGRLWIATNNGLDLYDTNTGLFIDFMKKNDKEIIPNVIVQALGIDKRNRLWINCFGGHLTSLNLDDFSDYRIYNLCDNEPYRDQGNNKHIVTDEQGNVWSAHGNGGFVMYDYKTDSFTRYTRSAIKPEGLNSDSVWDIFIDKVGNIWIGTYGGGVNVAYKYNQAILHYSSISGNKNTLSFNNVTGFQEDLSGNIWVCTDGGGLNRFNANTNSFTVYTKENSDLGSNATLDVCLGEPQEIWCATWAGGLSVLNTETNRIKKYNTGNSNLPDENYFGVFKDSKERIWATYFHGIVQYDRKKDSFITYSLGTEGFWVLVDIFEDDEGIFWITSERGLHIFNPETGKFNSLYTGKDFTKFIPDNWTTAVRQSAKNTYWIATKNGLCKYSNITKTFERFSTADGLPSNYIKSIEIDNSGLLWVGTNRGLFTLDPESKQIDIYGISDGIQGNEFKDGASYKTSDGKLYFGGTTGGFNIFQPGEMKKNIFVPNLAFTDFKLFNKSVEINGADSLLKKSILLTDKIFLDYDQSVFSFEFVSLNFEASEQNQYAYIMEGFEKEWNYVGNVRTANYTNLSPGEYTFRVKASNNHGLWNEEGTSIKLVIAPPFWQTWWFRILLFILSLAAVILFIRIRIQSVKNHNKILEQKVRSRTDELRSNILELKKTQNELKITNDTKDKFFSIISHDLRSPFFSLLGLTEMAIKESAELSKEEIIDLLVSIEKTSTAVYNLLENLLEWSRIQRGQINYSPQKLKLNEVINNVTNLLEAFAKNKNIRMVNKIDDEIQVYADVNMLNTVIRNLTSNAIKFSNNKEKIEYSAAVLNNKVEVSIRDYGVGIDESTLAKLFRIDVHKTAFGTNNESGTGLGLILCKELVEKQGGEIKVESELGKGSVFTFTLNPYKLFEKQLELENTTSLP